MKGSERILEKQLVGGRWETAIDRRYLHLTLDC